MRRKRELSISENVEKHPVKRRGNLKPDKGANNKAAEVSEDASDSNRSRKSARTRLKRKTTEVVSEYFVNENKNKKQINKPVMKKKRDNGQSKENKDCPESACDTESAEENEFEESDVVYRSPVAARSARSQGKVAARSNSRNSNNKHTSVSKNMIKKRYDKRKSEDREEGKTEKVKKIKLDVELKEKCKKRGKRSGTNQTEEKMLTKSEVIESDNGDINSKGNIGLKGKIKKTKQKTSSASPTVGREPGSAVKFGNKNVKKRKDNNDKSETATDMVPKTEDAGRSLADKKKTPLPKTIDHTDITAVLLHMEGAVKMSQMTQPSTSKADTNVDDEVMSDSDGSDADSVDGDNANASDDSEDDWEEVEDHHGLSPKKSQVPDKPVEFTLDAPLVNRKRQKKEFDWKAYLRRKINRFKKEIAMEIHKVHLLCLTARCLYLHNICQDKVLCAQAMSVVLVTREITVSPKKCTVDQLGKMVTWIQQTYTVDKTAGDEKKEDSMRLKLRRCLQEQCVSNNLEFVLVCLLLLRQVGFNARLIMSLQPLPFKETSTKTTGRGESSSKKSNNKKSNKATKTESASCKPVKQKTTPVKKKSKPSDTNKKSSKNGEKLSKDDSDRRKKGKSSKNDSKGGKSGSGKERSSRRCSKELPKGAYVDGDNHGDSEEDYDPKMDIDEEEVEDNAKKKGKGKAKLKREADKSEESIDISDSDFEEDSILFRTQALKKTSPSSKNRKVVSSDSDTSLETSSGADQWIEVYLEKEHRWICVDCVSGRLDKPYDVEHNATQPVTYIIGVNNDGHFKDVTQRYASQWLTSTRKLRADPEWWEDTLTPYICGDSRLDKLEDQEIQAHLQKRPLPTSIGDFKSHPLYALQRHLLKFEAIYPPSAVPLGYIRGEPVFARECVYTLHSRENWLKEGRAVRIGEEPYKYVKSRPKWNKPKENPEAKDLEIFGIWQTEVYIPPPAVDGKVPRNAHGNVEMFMSSMLPAGTVHLKLPGLNKISKKLDIDCAPAMVGWDHHCGFSHPLMDGWIVCEEFKDILLAAWDEEQEIIREKEAAKREKRVYDNWRKLIRGLLIRERLKKTFDFESDKKKEEPSTSKKRKSDAKDNVKRDHEPEPERATDVRHAWPQNRLNADVTAYKVEQL